MVVLLILLGGPSYSYRENLHLIIYISNSMSNRPQIHHKNTQRDESLAYEDQNSSSNYSLSKARKIRRSYGRKKHSKIVHTFCFFQIGKDGQTEAIYYQEVRESALRSSKDLSCLAHRQFKEVGLKAIEKVKRSNRSMEKQPDESIIKPEAELVVPDPTQLFPAPFYYVF